MPGISLSIYVVILYCKHPCQFDNVFFGAFKSIFCFSALFALIIGSKACVKSSSDLVLLSCLTDGLTEGGGTGNTEQIIHSGLEYL